MSGSRSKDLEIQKSGEIRSIELEEEQKASDVEMVENGKREEMKEASELNKNEDKISIK